MYRQFASIGNRFAAIAINGTIDASVHGIHVPNPSSVEDASVRVLQIGI